MVQRLYANVSFSATVFCSPFNERLDSTCRLVYPYFPHLCFQCEFCGQHFQTKGDLPKHFRTNKHNGDPQIPKPGSTELKIVMNRSERYSLPDFFARHGGYGSMDI